MLSKFSVSVLAIIISSSVDAQFSKGDRMVGVTIGNIFFNNTKSETSVASIGGATANSNHYGASINPQLGWFISGKTVVGVSLNIHPSRQSTSFEEDGATFQKDKVNGFDFGLGGFARTYFDDDAKFLPFAQAGFNAGLSNQETSGFYYGGSGSTVYKQTYEGKSSGGFFTNASLTFGVTRKLSESVGLDLFIGYNYSYTKGEFNRKLLIDYGNDGTWDESHESETESKYTNHGFVLGAGFQVFLKKRK